MAPDSGVEIPAFPAYLRFCSFLSGKVGQMVQPACSRSVLGALSPPAFPLSLVRRFCPMRTPHPRFFHVIRREATHMRAAFRSVRPIVNENAPERGGGLIRVGGGILALRKRECRPRKIHTWGQGKLLDRIERTKNKSEGNF